MKFLHAADIHLDSPLRGLERYESAPLERIRGATRRALENLVDCAIAERVDFLLVAGDLYDGDWPDYNTGLFFVRQMVKLREAGVPVFLVRGNHDAKSLITRDLRLPEHVRGFASGAAETHCIESLGVAIHGRSFATAAVTENLAACYPPAVPGHFNIGLLHTSATGFEGHANYAPCSVADLEAKGYDYWALGHVHVRTTLKEDGPWIVFPGNLQGRHARETGVKGASLVSVEHGRVTEVEHRALDVVRWAACQVDLSGCEFEDEAIERVRVALEAETRAAGERLLAGPIVLRGTCGTHSRIAARPEHFVNELRAMAAELGDVWIERVRIETKPRGASDEISPAREHEDALDWFFRGIRTMRNDPAAMKEFAAQLDPLKLRLPAELWNELGFDSSERFEGLMDEAEAILARKLHPGNAFG